MLIGWNAVILNVLPLSPRNSCSSREGSDLFLVPLSLSRAQPLLYVNISDCQLRQLDSSWPREYRSASIGKLSTVVSISTIWSGVIYLSLRILPGNSQVKYHGFELELYSLWQNQGKHFRLCWLQAPIHSFTVLCWMKVGEKINYSVIAVAWLQNPHNMVVTCRISISLWSFNSAGLLTAQTTHPFQVMDGWLDYWILCSATDPSSANRVYGLAMWWVFTPDLSPCGIRKPPCSPLFSQALSALSSLLTWEITSFPPHLCLFQTKFALSLTSILYEREIV